MFKQFLLGETRQRMGFFIGTIAALLLFLALVALFGLLGGFAGNASWGAAIGAFMGLGLAPAIVWGNYKYGLVEIPTNYRGIPTWFGERVSDPEFEMAEGIHWIFKYFDAMGRNVKLIGMVERTTKLADIPIEVAHGNKVPVTLTIQWKPQAGKLVEYDSVGDVVESFSAEAKEAARTFGIAHEDLDDLVHENFAGHLGPIVLEALQRRSRGEISCLCVTVNKGVKSVSHVFTQATEVNDAEPWGVEFLSVSVSDYALPEEISSAADQIDEAERNIKASAKLRAGMVDSMDDFIKRGVNPTTAMSQAHSLATPDRPHPVMTHNFVGFEGIVRSLVDGLLVYSGKSPIHQQPEATSGQQQNGE